MACLQHNHSSADERSPLLSSQEPSSSVNIAEDDVVPVKPKQETQVIIWCKGQRSGINPAIHTF